jgi:hypothetical protein
MRNIDRELVAALRAAGHDDIAGALEAKLTGVGPETPPEGPPAILDSLNAARTPWFSVDGLARRAA